MEVQVDMMKGAQVVQSRYRGAGMEVQVWRCSGAE
jgi:hypothetical protein